MSRDKFKIIWIKICFFLLLSVHQFDCGFIVNKSTLCTKSGPFSDPVCKEILSGFISLRNQETYRLNITSKDAASTNFTGEKKKGFFIDIAKSEVTFSYRLKYALDVFDRFEEEVYEFSYSKAGDNAIEYCYRETIDFCEEHGQLPITPERLVLFPGYGRCCFCPRTVIWDRITEFRRANFRCNLFELVFGNALWTTKSCPRIFGPWYSAFEINNYDWHFGITVSLHWWPVPGSLDSKLGSELNPKIYVLSSSNPYIYDAEFDVKIGLKGVSLIAEQPPSLADKTLFIPFFPQDHPLVKGCFGENRKDVNDKIIETEGPCIDNFLMISNRYVDLTGEACDKIGTSLQTWFDVSGKFCEFRPGYCMANQIGSYRDKDDKLKEMGMEPLYNVKKIFGEPAIHLWERGEADANFRSTSTSHYLGYRYKKEHVTDLEIEIGAEEIKWIRTVSSGLITSLRSPMNHHCSGNYDACLLLISIKNTGNIEARYIVQVPFCYNSNTTKITQEITAIDPVGISVQSGETSNVMLSFKVITTNSINITCTVQLLDSDNQILDEKFWESSIAEITRLYQGLQDPPGKVQFEVIPMEVLTGGNKTFWSVLGYHTPGKCDCGLNIFCYLSNFSACLDKFWRFIIIASILIVFFIGLIIFWPVILPILSMFFRVIFISIITSVKGLYFLFREKKKSIK